MNNKNWMTTLMNKSKKINMFGRKKNNNGAMWASLIGLGVSAAAYSIGRNQNQNQNGANSLQNLMRNIQQGSKNISLPNMVTEFSEELSPKEGSKPDAKSSKQDNNEQ